MLILAGLALPRTASVTVDIDIDAHPATVFALVNDLHRMSEWSPLFDPDPNVRVVHSGPDRGVGATMTWDGAIIGTGTKVITDSRPFEHVTHVINPGESGVGGITFQLGRNSVIAPSPWFEMV